MKIGKISKRDLKKDKAVQHEMYESGHHMITRVKLNVKPLSGNDSRFTEQQPCRYASTSLYSN